MDYAFNWRVVWQNWDFLISGITLTLGVTAASLSCAIVIGLAVGLMRLSKKGLLRRLAMAYVEIFRNTPALVQLIWVYYCLPVLVGINLDATSACIVALSTNGAAYVAEIFRAGIQGVPPGQVEAARSIGMSYGETMRKIILPQATRKMIPPFVNEAVSLLKYSSLVSVLGVSDLTYQAQVLSTTTFRPIEIFTFIGVVYFLVCWMMSSAAQVLERRLAVSDR
ncbi:amino acid ABC transporter permease [Azospirillum rugosum]|uniref:His/Glu/Gln/Arg/opine family amino acid ABC transporter permease subunit n=1 Tax=Azospirillum rugosum TaxID=416170 RepID=A0ABS4SM10_9PROT|nr:amino acid ABC transporter permease [Azospirillum rugosum]MBP2293269.1 His/Glu/Gln/Arg/opine family amino acid ABC transporter permease subunit [Azospirillum rugosum]